MPTPASLIIAAFAAYLLGSVSFAVIFSYVFGLADPRSYGSKNPGATNVLRSGNKLAAFLTLLFDGLKGWVAVELAVMFAPEMHWSAGHVALIGICALFGHLYPVFLKFKGGKGVATAAGVILAMNVWLGLAVLATWIAAVTLSRYSSLGAILAAAAAPMYAFLAFGFDATTFATGVISMALIYKHWGNIQRLLAGKEPKLGKK